MERAYVGIGSNLAEPAAQCREALRRLASLPKSRLWQVSSLYRSAPVGPLPQDPFVNAVAGLDTQLPPLYLLGELLALERAMGREPGPRWGPRVVDLDLLLYGSLVLEG
ncbi:MAG: 2-amino-4-hydroxy-6-hydroxymethyldihydropteridine diphosphokinase, partial [Nitrospinota bacterium]